MAMRVQKTWTIGMLAQRGELWLPESRDRVGPRRDTSNIRPLLCDAYARRFNAAQRRTAAALL